MLDYQMTMLRSTLENLCQRRLRCCGRMHNRDALRPDGRLYLFLRYPMAGLGWAGEKSFNTIVLSMSDFPIQINQAGLKTSTNSAITATSSSPVNSIGS
jgi:hypothetical protein